MEVVAFDVDDGSLAWRLDYLGTDAEPQGFIHGLAVSPDGRTVYATGHTFTAANTDGHMVVVALDAATGAVLWERHPVADSGKALGLAVSADGAQLAVTGYSLSTSAAPWRMTTTVLDAGTGATEWVRVWADAAATGLRVLAAPQPAGSGGAAFYVAGNKIVGSDHLGGDLVTMAFSATGEQLWSGTRSRGDKIQNWGPGDFVITPDGTRLVYQSLLIGWETWDTQVVAIDAATGQEVWNKIYTSGFQPSQTGQSLAMDPGGDRVYLSTVNITAPSHVDTVAYRVSDGAQVWAASLTDRTQTGYFTSLKIVANPVKSQVHIVADTLDCCDTPGPDGVQSYWALAVTYDAVTGQRVGLNRYGDATYTQDPRFSGILYGLAVTPDGGRMIAAMTVEERIASDDPFNRYVMAVAWDTPGAGGGGPPEDSQDIIATVPEGEPGAGSLVLSVDPDDRTVTLPEMTMSGDRLASSGGLRPVTVTDTRAGTDPGWDASAQVSDFTSTGGSFGGGFLGWAPEVSSASEGQSVTAGAVVAPGFPTGDGLSVPRTLASAQAGGGLGSAVLGAGLVLEIPVDTPAGRYRATLTLTAI